MADDPKAPDLELQLARARKMEALGRLARGIAHDLGNILSVIEGQTAFLSREMGPPEARRDGVQTIARAADQAQALLDRIRAFARDADTAPAAFDLTEPVRGALILMRAGVEGGVEVEGGVPDGPMAAVGNATQISQALLNLCINARDAMEGGGGGTLSLGLEAVRAEQVWGRQALLPELPAPTDLFPIHIEEPAPGRICLSLGHLACGARYGRLRVQDTGAGIARDVMEHIFEPFYTTKIAEKGTGLGLATVHGVVTAHRGALTIDSILGQGARFDLYVPLTGGPAPAPVG